MKRSISLALILIFMVFISMPMKANAFVKPGRTIKKSKITKSTRISGTVKKKVKSASKISNPVKKGKTLSLGSDGAVLMDLSTGKIVYQKNMHEKLAPASTTKILTGILTLERCNLNSIVTIGDEPTLEPASKIYLKKGEKISVKDLLYAMMIDSANDAAVALADNISGSKKEFAKLMNKKAKTLGCNESNFKNPNGLYETGHITSAYDLAVITKYAMTNPKFKQIVSTVNYTIGATNKSPKRILTNHNKMLLKTSYFYKGCIGVKTGYTSQSRHTLVTAASRNGRKLVAVMLHDKSVPYEDAKVLLNYGFSLKK